MRAADADEVPAIYVVVVAEVVRGKSVGPKGYTRYKPFEYTHSYKAHGIVYAKAFIFNNDAEAMAEKKNAERQVFGRVKSAHVSVINASTDSTVGGDAYLYDGTDLSNQILRKWKIWKQVEALGDALQPAAAEEGEGASGITVDALVEWLERKGATIVKRYNGSRFIGVEFVNPTVRRHIQQGGKYGEDNMQSAAQEQLELRRQKRAVRHYDLPLEMKISDSGELLEVKSFKKNKKGTWTVRWGSAAHSIEEVYAELEKELITFMDGRAWYHKNNTQSERDQHGKDKRRREQAERRRSGPGGRGRGYF